MRKRLAPPEPKKEEGKKFELLDHRAAVIAAYRNGDETIELDGRKFGLRLKNVSNVDYVIVAPVEGFTPCGNFILEESQFRAEMERRGKPLEDRKPLPESRKRTPPAKR